VASLNGSGGRIPAVWVATLTGICKKEGLGEILVDKSPSAPSLCSPPFSKGAV